MAIVNRGRLEAVDELLGQLAQIVRKARVEGDRDALAYVGERLQETSESIRVAVEHMDAHLTRKRL